MAEQGLVVVKDNLFIKISRMLKNIFNKEKNSEYFYKQINVEKIKKFDEEIQQEIRNARSAFRKYIINNTENIEQELFSTITTEMMNNQQNIERVIEINEDKITFNEILDLIDIERKSKKKVKEENNKIYRMPLGVIGVECRNTKECIENMLKAISTRNSIFILNDDFTKYKTEELILLVIKQCLQKFNIDSNLIQMCTKAEIELNKLDKVFYCNIEKNEKIENEKEIIYIYKDSDLYDYEINEEYERLCKNIDNNKRKVHVITGNFIDVAKFLEDKKSNIVVIYTDNEDNAYKLTNWVNSDNVFVNKKISKCVRNKKESKSFFKLKKIDFKSFNNKE